MLGANSLVSFDSDAVGTSYNAPTAVGVKTYSSIDDLPSTAATGEKALVTSINTLYLYNSGWYKIALINNPIGQVIPNKECDPISCFTFDFVTNGAF